MPRPSWSLLPEGRYKARLVEIQVHKGAQSFGGLVFEIDLRSVRHPLGRKRRMVVAFGPNSNPPVLLDVRHNILPRSNDDTGPDRVMAWVEGIAMGSLAGGLAGADMLVPSKDVPSKDCAARMRLGGKR